MTEPESGDSRRHEARATPDGAPAAPGGLRGRVLRAAAFGLGGHAGSQLLRLASNLILARLLFPEAFGVMALAWLVVNALTMLSDVGIRSSVIRDDRGDDPRFLHTAWTLQVLRGALLWAVASALAVPMATFYDEPLLAKIVPVAALVGPIAGFESIRLLTATRRIELGRVVGVELAGQAIGLVAMVGWALVDRSVWALVVGGLVRTAARVALSHVALPGPRDRFGWDRDAVGRIVGFGKWILVSTAITFLATRLDVVLLGKLVPMASLGVYSIGVMIAQMPQTPASRLGRAVLLPALSEARRQGTGALASAFERARGLVLPAMLLAVLGALSAAPLFVGLLYDDRYRDAGWIAQLSLLPLWFAFLQFTARSALEAVGRSRALAQGNAVKLVVTGLACLAGYRLGGIPGLILGVGLGAFAGYATIAFALRSAGLSVARQDLAWSLGGLALASVVAFGSRALAPQLGVPHEWATLGAGLVVILPLAGAFAGRLRELLRGSRAG